MTRRVLVVQSQAHERDVLGRTLERAGYMVFFAETGEAAAATLTTQPVDGVVLDLDLPNMTGQTLFHVIVSQWPELRRRIAVTSDVENQGKHQEWLDLYQLPILKKPFRLADARALVDILTGDFPLEANGA